MMFSRSIQIIALRSKKTLCVLYSQFQHGTNNLNWIEKTSSLHHRIQIICCLMVPWKWGKCFKNSFTPPNGPKACLFVVSPRISNKSVEKKYRCERDVPTKFPDVVKHFYIPNLWNWQKTSKKDHQSDAEFLFS